MWMWSPWQLKLILKNVESVFRREASRMQVLNGMWTRICSTVIFFTYLPWSGSFGYYALNAQHYLLIPQKIVQSTCHLNIFRQIYIFTKKFLSQPKMPSDIGSSDSLSHSVHIYHTRASAAITRHCQNRRASNSRFSQRIYWPVVSDKDVCFLESITFMTTS